MPFQYALQPYFGQSRLPQVPGSCDSPRGRVARGLLLAACFRARSRALLRRRRPSRATRGTEIRTLRAADDVWLPALARADAEGIPLSEVLIAALRTYGDGQLAPARQFTFKLGGGPRVGARPRRRPRCPRR
jgi:hypothetical protein